MAGVTEAYLAMGSDLAGIVWNNKEFFAEVYMNPRVLTMSKVRELEGGGALVKSAETYTAAKVEEATGMKLSEDAPFGDESLSNALGEKLGTPVRTLKDRASIKEDLVRYAGKQIGGAAGVEVDWSSRESIRRDVGKEAAKRVGESLGIPLTGTSREKVIEDLKAYGTRELEREFAENLSSVGEQYAGELDGKAAAAAEKYGSEANYEENVFLADAAMQSRVATNLLNEQGGDMASGMTKVNGMSSRQVSNRTAQRTFRARHGNRLQYMPLGGE